MSSGPDSATPSSGARGRIASLDVGRGLVVVLMIFTDQLESLTEIPRWLQHVQNTRDDAMGIRDFGPGAFLFIVGLSIPVALERRRIKAVAPPALFLQIAARAAVLLLLGLTMANAYHWSGGTGNLPRVTPPGWRLGLWDTLVWICWGAAMIRPPGDQGFRSFVGRTLRWAALAGLVILACVAVRNPAVDAQVQSPLSSILGVIGISYFVASVVAMGCRNDRAILVGAMAMAISIYLAARNEYFAGKGSGWLSVGELLGSYPFITLSGVLAWSVAFSPGRQASDSARVEGLVGLGAILLIEAAILHRLQGINRMEASPSWAVGCAAVCCWFLAFLHWLLEIRGLAAWASPLAAVGKNALTVYLLPWFLWSLANLLGLPGLVDLVGTNLIACALACIAYTLVVISLALSLEKAGLVIRA
jgi:predicted acyltransferase